MCAPVFRVFTLACFLLQPRQSTSDRPSDAGGARSKSSTAISTPAGASPSPGPSSLAGSPEPAYRALGGGRRGSSRAKSRVKSYAEDDDDEFEREMRSLEKKARRGSVKEEA